MGQCCSSETKENIEITTHFIEINIPPLNLAVEFDLDDTIRFREYSLKINRRYGEFFKEKIDLSDCTELPDGRRILETGTLYVGTWKEGKMSGYGECLYSNNDFYSGNFSNNERNGRGRLILRSYENYKEKDVEYIGEFKDNRMHGKGKIIYDSTHYYEGDWENDLPNGKGEEIWRDPETQKSMKYIGSFVDGLKEGKGRFEIIDEETFYEGDFLENQRTGFGKCVWADGRIYEGNWISNEMDGEGEFIYPDGSIYKGEFAKGKKEGMGEYKWADKIHKYIGNWKDGKRHGYGVLYKHKVGELFGEWSKDEFVEQKID